MNPFAKDIAAKVLQLLLIGSPLVTKLGLSQGEVEQVVTTIMAAGGTVWTLWSTYHKRRTLDTAKAIAEITEADLNAAVKNGRAPDLGSAVYEIPVLNRGD